MQTDYGEKKEVQGCSKNALCVCVSVCTMGLFIHSMRSYFRIYYMVSVLFFHFKHAHIYYIDRKLQPKYVVIERQRTRPQWSMGICCATQWLSCICVWQKCAEMYLFAYLFSRWLSTFNAEKFLDSRTTLLLKKTEQQKKKTKQLISVDLFVCLTAIDRLVVHSQKSFE